MFCALLTSRYQVSVYRTNGPLVCLKNVRIFCTAKDSHIFSTKNSSGFDNVVGIYLTK